MVELMINHEVKKYDNCGEIRSIGWFLLMTQLGLAGGGVWNAHAKKERLIWCSRQERLTAKSESI